MVDRITKLIAGEIPPLNKDDFEILFFIGSVRKRPWPEKWIKCGLCSTEFKGTGFPAPRNNWHWPIICDSCADRWDSDQHPAKPNWAKSGRKLNEASTNAVRDPYNS